MPMMTVTIPRSLHKAIPRETSVSNIIRQVITDAVVYPDKLPAAFASRLGFKAEDGDTHRYSVYITEEESANGKELAARFLLSFNQMVQILLEDLLFQAGRWPTSKQD